MNGDLGDLRLVQRGSRGAPVAAMNTHPNRMAGLKRHTRGLPLEGPGQEAVEAGRVLARLGDPGQALAGPPRRCADSVLVVRRRRAEAIQHRCGPSLHASCWQGARQGLADSWTVGPGDGVASAEADPECVLQGRAVPLSRDRCLLRARSGIIRHWRHSWRAQASGCRRGAYEGESTAARRPQSRLDRTAVAVGLPARPGSVRPSRPGSRFSFVRTERGQRPCRRHPADLRQHCQALRR